MAMAMSMGVGVGVYRSKMGRDRRMRECSYSFFVTVLIICCVCRFHFPCKEAHAFSPIASFSFVKSSSNCSKNACGWTSRSSTKDALLESEKMESHVKVYSSDSTSSGSGNDRVEVECIGKDFIKPRLDNREYRAIRLRNSGLECLLVSDPLTDVESAAVHVKAGHFDDPPDRAGLAHFHEHMLFLGTQKYPDENEYETFLGSHGGSSNAYTDMQDTNYYFSVQAPLLDEDDDDDDDDSQQQIDTATSEGLKGALDRFAQFFIAPNFNEDMVEREMRAVDSEYKNSITSDSWRFYQTLKHGSNSQHPFSKFGCGNYETLSTKPSPRDDLFAFWNKHYRGDNMKLCVVGRASLDALEQSVVETFGQLPTKTDIKLTNKNLQKTNQNIKNNQQLFVTEHSQYDGIAAFGSDQLGKIREIIPVLETRAINIYFATPPMDDPVLKETHPYRVISHLLGHESPGSLHSLLLQQGFINDLTSGGTFVYSQPLVST